MKPLVLAVVSLAVLCAGAGGPELRRGSHPSLPWLHNLQEVVAVDAGDRLVTLSLEGEVDPSCQHQGSLGMALVAEVAPSPGRETVVASYAHGVQLFGAEGQLVASAPGYPCGGSADELEVLAVGRAFGAPIVVLAVTTGGRREQLTWIGLYQLGHHGRLEPVFAAAVEQREDGIVRRGDITLLPGAVMVRDPWGGTEFWVRDEASGVFVPRGGYEPSLH